MSTDQTETVAPAREPRRRGWLVFLRDVLVIIVVALLVSFLVKTFLVRSFYIPSASMNQTLIEQDRILVDEITPRFSTYGRGDVVVFRDPGGWLPSEPTPARPPVVEAIDWVLSLVGLTAPDSDDHLVKRVIGIPGDHVVCCNALGQTTVNGVPIDETPYLNLPPGRTAPNEVAYDVTVPEGSLWVLGDNRDNSRDSRFHQDQPGGGFVPIDNVVGRAFLITWPFPRFGGIDTHHGVFAGVPAEEDAG
jgi:signal peptidase I